MSEPLLKTAIRNHRARELQQRDGIAFDVEPSHKYKVQAAKLDWLDYDAIMEGKRIYDEVKASQSDHRRQR